MDFILLLLIILLPLTASLIINATYKKYLNISCQKKISGFEVARSILDRNDLGNVHVVETKGNVLGDHYDPKRKAVRLSTEVFHTESIAAIAVAAHETGHAIQDKEGYFFLKIRSFIFPVVKFCSSISYFVILIGFLTELANVIYIGIGLVGAGLIFELITLPVEFNASKIALESLKSHQLVSDNEIAMAKKVLTAAAWTYVAGTLATLLQMLRLFLLNDRD